MAKVAMPLDSDFEDSEYRVPYDALVEAGHEVVVIGFDIVRGRTLTSWPSVKTDLKNAGALWVDQQVCEDGTLITSRKPDDLEAFSGAILERLSA